MRRGALGHRAPPAVAPSAQPRPPSPVAGCPPHAHLSRPSAAPVWTLGAVILPLSESQLAHHPAQSRPSAPARGAGAPPGLRTNSQARSGVTEVSGQLSSNYNTLPHLPVIACEATMKAEWASGNVGVVCGLVARRGASGAPDPRLRRGEPKTTRLYGAAPPKTQKTPILDQTRPGKTNRLPALGRVPERAPRASRQAARIGCLGGSGVRPPAAGEWRGSRHTRRPRGKNRARWVPPRPPHLSRFLRSRLPPNGPLSGHPSGANHHAPAKTPHTGKKRHSPLPRLRRGPAQQV